MKKLSAVLLSLALSVGAAHAADPAASKFPEKSVEFIVPWSAGGGYGLLIRAIGNVFPKYANGQQLVVKNVPGGGAAIGITEAMRAKPDGYTLTAQSTPIITKMHWSNVPFSIDSFEPVMMFADIPSYFIVEKDSPYKNLNDVVAAAKSKPGTITLGNGGSGGGNHLVGLSFQKTTDAKFKDVPFEGGNPALTALMGKHIDVVVASSPEGIPQALAGDLRILGVFSDQRMAQFPDVKTANEQGIKFYGTMWRGIMAPKGTPEAIVSKLDQIFKQCMDDPAFVKMASEMGWPRKYFGPAEFKKFIASEDSRWKEMIISLKLGDRYKSQYK